MPTTIDFSEDSGSELFYRKDERWAHSEIVETGQKRPASVENLDRTLLTLYQQDFFDFIKQKELIKQKDKLAPVLLETFRKNFVDTETKRILKALPLSSAAEGRDPASDARKKAASEYEKKKKLITTLIEKEAWKTVLYEAIPEEALTKRFSAHEVMKIANVNETDMSKLENIVLGVQKKIYKWTDKSLNIERGEIVEETPQGTLWPYSKLVRSKRQGSQNFIDIKVERELIQYILFLHTNFIKYRLYVSTTLKNPNATRTYEVLVESLSPKYKNKWRDVRELMKEFGVSYKEGSDFLSKVIYVSVKKINKLLGINVTVDKDYEGKKIVRIRFLISRQDSRVLTGEDNIWRMDARQRDTFGYFIALSEYFEEPFDIEMLYEKASEYNDRIESDRQFALKHKNLYDIHLENIDAYDELLMLHDLGKLPGSYELDFDLRILVGQDGNALATTAVKCLEAIRKKERALTKTPSLFDMDEPATLKRTPEDYVPFVFQLSKARKVEVHKGNYGEYAQQIKMAIQLGKDDSFGFSSTDAATVFNREFFAEMNAIECDVISEEPQKTVPGIEEKQCGGADGTEMHAMFKRINPKTRSSVEACNKTIDEILQDKNGEAYTREDIAMVMHWLEFIDTRAKKPFYSTIIKTHNQFKKNFEQMYALAQSSDTNSRALNAPHETIANLLDELENT